MSEYLVVRTQFNDAGCLKESIKEMGYDFEEHDVPQELIGYQGDRSRKAHIIIRRKGGRVSGNDVGFIKNSNGSYDMVISDMFVSNDSRSSNSVDFSQRLTQIYAKHRSLMETKNLGLILNSINENQNKEIRISLYMVD